MNKPCLVLVALLTGRLLSARAADAQKMTGFAAADSAAVARAAWARAAKALTVDDLAGARREVARAAESWPVQPSYIWADAVLAARAGDTTAVLSELQAYAALGLGRNLHADTTFASFAALPGFAALAAAHDSNSAPLVRDHVRGSLSDSTFWPEGVDYDPRTRRFYIASVRHRTVAELAPNGTSRELWPRDGRSLGALLGVRVDTSRGALWVTTSGLPQAAAYARADSTIAALLRVRISDGVVEERWDLPAIAGGHVLGDLALGPNGDVFTTDSREPVLYRLRSGQGALEPYRSPLFHSLQGIAPAPDGRVVYVADYSHGILRVDLDTREVVRVADPPRSTSLGCDGIVWDRGAIIAVQNGVVPARVVRFVLDKSGQRFARADVLDRNPLVADEPTIGTMADGEFVYVANSQWEKYDESGARIGGKQLTPPLLLGISLPH